MNSNKEFKDFALRIKQEQESDLRRWATQSDNLVLRELARDVLQVAGEGKEKVEKKR